jgi:hypothetical protein
MRMTGERLFWIKLHPELMKHSSEVMNMASPSSEPFTTIVRTALTSRLTLPLLHTRASPYKSSYSLGVPSHQMTAYFVAAVPCTILKLAIAMRQCQRSVEGKLVPFDPCKSPAITDDKSSFTSCQANLNMNAFSTCAAWVLHLASDLMRR